MSRIRRRFWLTHGVTLIIVLIGVGLSLAVVRSDNARSRREAVEVMDRRALIVAEAVRRSVEATWADAVGAAGLILVSNDLTETEFDVFAETVGGRVGNLGLAYIPVIPSSELWAFLDRVQGADPSYELFSLGQDGSRIPSVTDGIHYPVLYLAPGPESDLDLRGFDAATDPVWVEVLERAATGGGASVSSLTQLFGQPDLWGFLVVAPIVESGEVTGFAVSFSRVEALVEGKLAASLSEVVDWSVSDVTVALGPSESPDQLRRVETLELGDRLWRVEVIPTESARKALAGGPVWLRVLLGLLVTGVAAATSHIGMGALRSREENAELRRMAEEKDEFLAAISHELRTPLTVVVGMAEILAETSLGSDPEVAEYVSLLRQQGTELARLVDNLLLLGRLDAEVLPMSPEIVDLVWEVERIIREVGAPPEVEVSISGSGDAWADPLRLRHVIRHLHTNALRHAHRRVTYRIENRAHEVLLAVADDGKGLAGSDLPHMFVAASGRKDTPGGPASLGLGLRVSKRLAIALGGDLTYRRTDSETVFAMRLPRAGVEEAARSSLQLNSQERVDVEA